MDDTLENLDMFKGLEVNELDVPEIGTAAELYMQSRENEETEETEDDNKKKKSSTPRIKKEPDGVLNPTWRYKEYCIKKLDYRYVDYVELVRASIKYKQGLNAEETLEIEVTDSWLGFLAFLIGCIEIKYKDKALEELSKRGIISDSIIYRDKIPVYLDKEIEDGIELYEITEFGFYIEYKHDSRNLFNAIQSAVNALGFRQDKVNVYMINHHVDKSLSIENDTDDEEVVKSKKKKSRTRKSDKSSDKSSEIKLTKFEDIEELGDFRLTLNKVNIEHTETKKLSELCTKDENNVPDKFDIQALIIDGEEMEISNNLVAGAMVLSNLYIYYEDSAYKEFISNTVIDNVGVTKDKHAYLGIMKTMQVYNTDLYFYYNGSNRKLVEYIWNIYESIGVDQSSLKFKYKTN